MPLGRVYIPPPTTPPKYVAEFSFPQHTIGNNKYNSKFNNIIDRNEDEDFLICSNNLRNSLNGETSKRLNFNYDVDINGTSAEEKPGHKNSGKAFRKIEIKILDTKYRENEDETTQFKEEANGNGNGKLLAQCNQYNKTSLKT